MNNILYEEDNFLDIFSHINTQNYYEQIFGGKTHNFNLCLIFFSYPGVNKNIFTQIEKYISYIINKYNMFFSGYNYKINYNFLCIKNNDFMQNININDNFPLFFNNNNNNKDIFISDIQNIYKNDIFIFLVDNYSNFLCTLYFIYLFIKNEIIRTGYNYYDITKFADVVLNSISEQSSSFNNFDNLKNDTYNYFKENINNIFNNYLNNTFNNNSNCTNCIKTNFYASNIDKFKYIDNILRIFIGYLIDFTNEYSIKNKYSNNENILLQRNSIKSIYNLMHSSSILQTINKQFGIIFLNNIEFSIDNINFDNNSNNNENHLTNIYNLIQKYHLINNNLYLNDIFQENNKNTKFINFTHDINFINSVLLKIIGNIYYLPYDNNNFLNNIKKICYNKNLSEREQYQSPLYLGNYNFINYIYKIIDDFIMHCIYENKKKSQEVEMIITMCTIIESKDDITMGHVKRVSSLIKKIIMTNNNKDFLNKIKLKKETNLLLDNNKSNLNFNDESNVNNFDLALLLSISSSMHDIGKIAIPDYILSSKYKLNFNTRSIIEKHTTIGNLMLGVKEVFDFNYDNYNNSIFENAKIITLNHHERWDGYGYPFGIKNNEIPFIARIVSVIDNYDALLYKRNYKTSTSKDIVIEYLLFNKNKKFDPDIVDLFISFLKKNI